MKTAQFIVKEAAYEGTYRNPYKRGGRAMKWGPWKKRSSHDTLAEALAAAVVTVGLSRRSVFYRGERLSEEAKILTGLSIEGELKRLETAQKEAQKPPVS